MTSTSRTPYGAQTPDRLTFDPQEIPLTPFARPTFIPSPQPVSKPTSSRLSILRRRLTRFWARCREIFDNNTGLLLVACSGIFGSLMNVMVKKLNSLDPPVPPLELILVRMLITWTCCVIYMSIKKVPDPVFGPKGVRLLLAFRGFCGFFGLFGSYFSLQYLSLSDATVLQFLAPMCTAVTGALLLKEEFKRSQAFASLCSLVGVVLIARPEFLFGHSSRHLAPTVDPIHDGIAGDEGPAVEATSAQRYLAVGAAMIGVIGGTGAYTSIRAIGKRAHTLHNLISFSGQCVIASSVLTLVTHTQFVFPKTLLPFLMLFAIGLFGFMGQILLTMGLQRETASRGTMAVYCQIIYATIYDRIFFHSTPSPLSILGTTIIMTSAIYVALSKENPKGTERDVAASPEDASLEEGLLANGEGSDEDIDVPKISEPAPVGDDKKPLHEDKSSL